MVLLLPHSQFMSKASIIPIALTTPANREMKRLENLRGPIKVISERSTSSWHINQLNRNVSCHTSLPSGLAR